MTFTKSCIVLLIMQQSTGIMDERLDDAINVLKDHAEGPLYPGHSLAAHVVSCLLSSIAMFVR
jgi:hypothetical protein